MEEPNSERGLSISEHDLEQMRKGFWTTGAYMAPALMLMGLVFFVFFREPWPLIIAGVNFLASCFFIPGYIRYRRRRKRKPTV